MRLSEEDEDDPDGLRNGVLEVVPVGDGVVTLERMSETTLCRGLTRLAIRAS